MAESKSTPGSNEGGAADPLVPLRKALLHVHKSLLDYQRIRYERENGRVDNPAAFLGFVLEHRDFAWLRPVSALIVEIDEALDEPAEQTPDSVAALMKQARGLFTGDATAEFHSRYATARDEDPDVLLAHVAVCRALR